MGKFLELVTTKTPDGDFHIILDSDSVARASGFGDIDVLRQRLPDELLQLPHRSTDTHPYQKLVKAYYDGDATALAKIPHSQTGTEFRRRVWNEIAAIPYGRTVSYKQLASNSGNDAAVRAAGTICGLNRLILIIPCHRVLKSDGSIGSYLYGPTIKESLLRREGALL